VPRLTVCTSSSGQRIFGTRITMAITQDSRTRSGNGIGRALLAWIAFFFALLVLVAVVNGFRGTVSDIAPVLVSGRDLKPNNRNVRVVGAVIDVRNTIDAPLSLLQVTSSPFEASDLARVTIDAGPVPAGVDVALLWIRHAEPGQIHEQPLALSRNRFVATALLDENAQWRGRIEKVVIGVKGLSGDPWRIERVTLASPGVASIARGFVDEWMAFDPWDGRSINVLFGGRESQRFYLPLLVFLAAAATLFYLRWWYRRRGDRLPAALAVLPFVAGWLVLDLRWQAELTVKAAETWSSFAGLPIEARHLRMEDGDLYRTVGVVKSMLPATPERIFVGSDFDYFRMRAAYHFYPHNVLSFGWRDGKVASAGDLVFLYQSAGVRFDAEHSVLIWSDGSRTPVLPIYTTTGAGLFRLQ